MKPVRAIVVFLGALGSFCSVAEPIASAANPSGPVRVEIFESVPDQTNWQFSVTEPAEVYTETAFGFVTLPTKYSSSGIKVDRGVPFLLRASASVTLPTGEHRILLRARTGSRLFVDGQPVLFTKFASLNADGHEEVPEAPLALAPDIRYLRPGHFESVTTINGDDKEHTFTLEALIGSKGRRPELGELSVSIASGEGSTFYVAKPKIAMGRESIVAAASPNRRISLTEEGWENYAAERRAFWKDQDVKRRQRASADEMKYWNWRHELAREQRRSKSAPVAAGGIDRFIAAKVKSAGLTPAPVIDDWKFLRRVTLDTIGNIPSPEQLDQFTQDKSQDRRAKAIERLLSHPGWADHWVSYWQDVLAENPGILKPMLNNTGPFRWWIHESLVDNKPMDRFVTELIMMEGSAYYGGPAGFGMASENDVPMAAKAQIVAQAFLGMELQCARCHDAPYHQFKQKDLFSLAAMLKKQPQAVPLSSSVPTNANIVLGRLVNVTLKPGSKVEPEWPFPQLINEEFPQGVLRKPGDPRERLAALITDARNERFAQVMVNRLWKHYLGWGLVEPVDDWEHAKPSHPELLKWLGDEFVTHNYDMKHVARLILNSEVYQRENKSWVTQANGPSVVDAKKEGRFEVASNNEKPETRLFAARTRRRMSAEQLIDSLFAAVGKPLNSEEMNLDVDGRRPVKDFNNLGTPARAWEFTSLSNERDRPALSMPYAQPIVDTLTTFGWRESRQNPLTVRDDSPNVLQPAALANSVLGHGRITRLSEESQITRMALQDQPLPSLIQSVFLRVLSRPPNAEEKATFMELLEPEYGERKVEPSASAAYKQKTARRPVSWSNHLNPEATKIKQELEREARAGDPPTERLAPSWRERMEDMLWALVNSPEFVFVP